MIDLLPLLPPRVQMRRTKGWRKPDGVVVVARPTKWGNPFTVAAAIETGWATDENDARAFAVECFEDWLYKGELSDWWFLNSKDQWFWMREHLDDLYGKSLGCWCPLDGPCHADILTKAANR